MLPVNGTDWGFDTGKVGFSESKHEPFYERFCILVNAWSPLAMVTGIPLYYKVTHTFEILPEPAE